MLSFLRGLNKLESSVSMVALGVLVLCIGVAISLAQDPPDSPPSTVPSPVVQPQSAVVTPSVTAASQPQQSLQDKIRETEVAVQRAEQEFLKARDRAVMVKQAMERKTAATFFDRDGNLTPAGHRLRANVAQELEKAQEAHSKVYAQLQELKARSNSQGAQKTSNEMQITVPRTRSSNRIVAVKVINPSDLPPVSAAQSGVRPSSQSAVPQNKPTPPVSVAAPNTNRSPVFPVAPSAGGPVVSGPAPSAPSPQSVKKPFVGLPGPASAGSGLKGSAGVPKSAGRPRSSGRGGLGGGSLAFAVVGSAFDPIVRELLKDTSLDRFFGWSERSKDPNQRVFAVEPAPSDLPAEERSLVDELAIGIREGIDAFNGPDSGTKARASSSMLILKLGELIGLIPEMRPSGGVTDTGVMGSLSAEVGNDFGVAGVGLAGNVESGSDKSVNDVDQNQRENTPDSELSSEGQEELSDDLSSDSGTVERDSGEVVDSDGGEGATTGVTGDHKGGFSTLGKGSVNSSGGSSMGSSDGGQVQGKGDGISGGSSGPEGDQESKESGNRDNLENGVDTDGDGIPDTNHGQDTDGDENSGGDASADYSDGNADSGQCTGSSCEGGMDNPYDDGCNSGPACAGFEDMRSHIVLSSNNGTFDLVSQLVALISGQRSARALDAFTELVSSSSGLKVSGKGSWLLGAVRGVLTESLTTEDRHIGGTRKMISRLIDLAVGQDADGRGSGYEGSFDYSSRGILANEVDDTGEEVGPKGPAGQRSNTLKTDRIVSSRTVTAGDHKVHKHRDALVRTRQRTVVQAPASPALQAQREVDSPNPVAIEEAQITAEAQTPVKKLSGPGITPVQTQNPISHLQHGE